MAHATAADYLAWTGEDTAPDDIDTRLEQASLDVDMAILVEYDDQDADVQEALMRATVIHASREFDPKTSHKSEFERVTLGPLTMDKNIGQSIASQQSAAARLVPLARDVLWRAGLLYRGVGVGKQGVMLL